MTGNSAEIYRNKVKLTFAKGASLDDPAMLVNSSLDGNTRRAIDIREGEAIDEVAFEALIGAAVVFNGRGESGAAKAAFDPLRTQAG